MNWHHLVNIPLRRAHPSRGEADGSTAPQSVSAFITPQSLATFPVASLVVKTCWVIAGALFPGAGENRWVGLVISLAVGVLLYTLSAADESLALTPKQRRAGRAIALINALFLFAAAAGLGEVATPQKPPQQPPNAATATASEPR